MRTMKHKFGYTLIELLIVITIVGILVAVSTVSYLTASKQSRDTKRKTDLEQIRQALETYRSENGTYPATTADLEPNYITTLPKDPTDNLTDYSPYTPADLDLTYTLCATLEITEASYCVNQP